MPIPCQGQPRTPGTKPCRKTCSRRPNFCHGDRSNSLMLEDVRCGPTTSSPMAALGDSRIAERRCGAAIRCSDLFCGFVWEAHPTPDWHISLLSVTEDECSLEDLRRRSDAGDFNVRVRLEQPTIGRFHADMLLSVETVSVQREERREYQATSLDEEGVSDSKLKWSAHDGAAAERKAQARRATEQGKTEGRNPASPEAAGWAAVLVLAGVHMITRRAMYRTAAAPQTYPSGRPALRRVMARAKHPKDAMNARAARTQIPMSETGSRATCTATARAMKTGGMTKRAEVCLFIARRRPNK